MAAGKELRKLVIIGDGAVGKTSLLHAFAFGKQFDEDQYNPTFHNTYKDSLSRRLITQQIQGKKRIFSCE